MPALRRRTHGVLPWTLGKRLVDVRRLQHPVGRRRIRIGAKGAGPSSRNPGDEGAAPLAPRSGITLSLWYLRFRVPSGTHRQTCSLLVFLFEYFVGSDDKS